MVPRPGCQTHCSHVLNLEGSCHLSYSDTGLVMFTSVSFNRTWSWLWPWLLAMSAGVRPRQSAVVRACWAPGHCRRRPETLLNPWRAAKWRRDGTSERCGPGSDKHQAKREKLLKSKNQQTRFSSVFVSLWQLTGGLDAGVISRREKRQLAGSYWLVCHGNISPCPFSTRVEDQSWWLMKSSLCHLMSQGIMKGCVFPCIM